MARKTVKSDKAEQPQLQLGDVFEVLGVKPLPEDADRPGGAAAWRQGEAWRYRPLINKKFVMLTDNAACLGNLSSYPYYGKADAETLAHCKVRVLGTTRTAADHWHLGRGYVAVFGGQAIFRAQLDQLVAVSFVREPDLEPPTFSLTFATDSVHTSSVTRLKKRPEGAILVGDVSIVSGGKFVGRPTQTVLYVIPRGVPQGGAVYYRCTHTDVGEKPKSGGLKRQVAGRLVHTCRELNNGHILYDIFEEVLVQSPDPVKDF